MCGRIDRRATFKRNNEYDNHGATREGGHNQKIGQTKRCFPYRSRAMSGKRMWKEGWKVFTQTTKARSPEQGTYIEEW